MQKKILDELNILQALPLLEDDIQEICSRLVEYYSKEDPLLNSSSCVVTIPLIGHYIWRSESPNFSLFEYHIKNSELKIKKTLQSEVAYV